MADESTQNPSFSQSPKESNKQNLWQDLLKPGDTSKQFCEWFWNGTNGNKLIEKLNTWNGQKHNWSSDYATIRREKDSPTIYGIVVNDDKMLGKDWKICKVGYTGISTGTDTGNRMEKVMEKTKKEKKQDKYKDASIIFKLPIHSTDSSPIRTTEERIRLNVGWKLDKELVKKLRLPNETEWILTKQEYLDNLKTGIGEKKGDQQTVTTNLFKENKDLKFKKYMTNQFSARTDKTELSLKQWVNKKIPEWLELRLVQTSGDKQQENKFEVYQKGSLPDKLQEMLQKFDKVSV